MHNEESVLENETHRLLSDFDIKTNHLISVRRLDLIIIITKRRLQNYGLSCSADHSVKLKESVKSDKYLDLARKLKKTLEYKSDDYTIYNLCSWYSHQIIDTRTGGLGKKTTGGDNPNYSIAEIGQNTEKSPGDLRKLAVTQTPVRNHRLTLVRKTR